MKTGLSEVFTFHSSAPVPTGVEVGSGLADAARNCARQAIKQRRSDAKPTLSWAIARGYIPRVEDDVKRHFAEETIASLAVSIEPEDIKNVRINVIGNPEQLRGVMSTQSGTPFTNWHTDFRIDGNYTEPEYRLAKVSRRACILDGKGTVTAVGDVEAPGAQPFTVSTQGRDPEQIMEPFVPTLVGTNSQIIRGPRVEMGGEPLRGDFTTQALDPGKWYEIPPDCLHIIPAEAELGRICITVDLCE